MYPVSLGFKEAESRIQALLKNGHHAEALVTVVFTFEKTVRRALRNCIVARGFTSKQAEDLLDRKGFGELKKLWQCFSQEHEPLNKLVGKGWHFVTDAQTMRNKLVHGHQVYKLAQCKELAQNVLSTLVCFRQSLLDKYGFDGWQRLSIRKVPQLQWSLKHSQQSTHVKQPSA